MSQVLHITPIEGRSEQLCRTFLPDGTTTSTTKCRFCGKEKWEHQAQLLHEILKLV